MSRAPPTPLTSEVKNPSTFFHLQYTPLTCCWEEAGGGAGKQKMQGLEEDQIWAQVNCLSLLNGETETRGYYGCTERRRIGGGSSVLPFAANCWGGEAGRSASAGSGGGVLSFLLLTAETRWGGDEGVLCEGQFRPVGLVFDVCRVICSSVN